MDSSIRDGEGIVPWLFSTGVSNGVPYGSGTMQTTYVGTALRPIVRRYMSRPVRDRVWRFVCLACIQIDTNVPVAGGQK